MKRATFTETLYSLAPSISIHALVKRATLYGDLCVQREYFNPRPREEGDSVLKVSDVDSVISIHALVKRATRTLSAPPSLRAISIHALVKRATVTSCRYLYKVDISIHALVKRATHPKRISRMLQWISIHALVKRATVFVG